MTPPRGDSRYSAASPEILMPIKLRRRNRPPPLVAAVTVATRSLSTERPFEHLGRTPAPQPPGNLELCPIYGDRGVSGKAQRLVSTALLGRAPASRRRRGQAFLFPPAARVFAATLDRRELPGTDRPVNSQDLDRRCRHHRQPRPFPPPPLADLLRRRRIAIATTAPSQAVSPQARPMNMRGVAEELRRNWRRSRSVFRPAIR